MKTIKRIFFSILIVCINFFNNTSASSVLDVNNPVGKTDKVAFSFCEYESIIIIMLKIFYIIIFIFFLVGLYFLLVGLYSFVKKRYIKRKIK